MSTVRSQTSVLVVGAGPTGLTLATILARYGIVTRIIEKKPRLSQYTKATNLMQRNLEIVAALGLADSLLAIGGKMRRIMVHSYGKCFGPRTMHLEESPYPDVLLCGQNAYEEVFAAALDERLGVPVEFNSELIGIDHSSDGAVAHVRTARGIEEIAAAYIAGCDGAAGATRTFTKHNFEPKKTGVVLRQGDCKLSWRRLSTEDQMWLFYFDRGFAVVVPLPGGVHRVITVEPKANVPDRNPTLDELQTKLRAVANDESIELSDPKWLSFTDLSMGIASGLRDGRVILAGDVGNPILPNGGQGMNTGISDAFNLGWKLASVMRDGAPDALLDSYETERLGLRRSLEKSQFNSLKYTTLVTPGWMQAIFRGVAEPALNIGGERKMAQGFSQLAINTRTSALTLERAGKRGVRAGDRVLDADVVLDMQATTLHRQIYTGAWTVLGFSGTSIASAKELAQTLSEIGRSDVVTYAVTVDACLDSTAVETARVLYDLDEVAHRAYGITHPTVYLVRPDGYVAARVRSQNIGELADYMTMWIPKAHLAFEPLPQAALREPERVVASTA